MSVRGLGALIAIAALLALAGVTLWRAEGGAPEIEAPGRIVVGAAGRDVDLVLRDAGAGPRALSARLVHARGETEVLAQQYPGSWLGGGSGREIPARVRIAPQELGVPDGSARLELTVRDWSWRGNESALSVPVEIDRVPPRVTVHTGLTYVQRAGSGAVAWSVSEPTARDGVRVAAADGSDAVFYASHPVGRQPVARQLAEDTPQGAPALAPAGARVALFAVGRDAPPDPEIRVLAEDEAGNQTLARWPVVVKERSFPTGNVTLPQTFLDQKVPALAGPAGIPTADLAAAFDAINTDLRRRNEARIRELLAGSAPQRLFDGAFVQLANSKVTSRFAEERSYFVGPKRVSEAIHYGYDLASTRAAPITASNAGRVAFAGELGIYGSAVLLDHGLGLASLYGHLSRLDVRAGDRVAKGQALGLSGATGLAGGDHLHFAILVGPTYVDPVEWWDPAWVRTHVDDRFPAGAARGG